MVATTGLEPAWPACASTHSPQVRFAATNPRALPDHDVGAASSDHRTSRLLVFADHDVELWDHVLRLEDDARVVLAYVDRRFLGDHD